MISVTEAVNRLTAAFSPLPAETVPVTEALGRVLAEPVLARITQPASAVAAVDGYAVRADDTQRRLPIRLYVIGELAAGAKFRGVVNPREAVRLSTGAPLPAGANAVIAQEAAVRDDDGYITVCEPVAASRAVRAAGQDFETGQVCLPAGKTVTARDIGLAAAMNVPWLKVRRRPRIALLGTGNEVVLPGEPVGPNQVIAANMVALSALITACGGVPLSLGIARDDTESLLGSAAAAEGADLLVTSSGASGGDHDLVYRVLGQRGRTIEFWKVAMRPGQPLVFGRTGQVPLLGLPGNPASALITALVFLRPLLRVLLAQPPLEGPLRPTARLGQPLPANDRRQTYLRASLAPDGDGEQSATPFVLQDNAILTTLATADCLIVRAPDAPAAAAGDRVDILPLGDGMIGV